MRKKREREDTHHLVLFYSGRLLSKQYSVLKFSFFLIINVSFFGLVRVLFTDFVAFIHVRHRTLPLFQDGLG